MADEKDPKAAQPAVATKSGAGTAKAGEQAVRGAESEAFTPYTGPSEIIPGGLYRRETKQQKGKHFGGDVADANGVVLATFDEKAENTGWPGDGDLTEDGEEWMKEHGEQKPA